MRSTDEFRAALSGSRGRSERLLVAVAGASSPQTDPHPVRVGFRVSKAVGNSVVRHRVYRQLRHLVRARLDAFAPGELVVVRALPAASSSSSQELGADLDAAIAAARAKLEGRKTKLNRRKATNLDGRKATLDRRKDAR